MAGKACDVQMLTAETEQWASKCLKDFKIFSDLHMHLSVGHNAVSRGAILVFISLYSLPALPLTAPPPKKTKTHLLL